MFETYASNVRELFEKKPSEQKYTLRNTLRNFDHLIFKFTHNRVLGLTSQTFI